MIVGGGGEEKQSWLIHLGVEEAGGSLDNGGAALIRRDLEDGALGIGEDGKQAQTHILRSHVQRKRVGKRLCLARLNLQAVLHDGQVAHDALIGGHVGGEVLGRPQRAVGKEELDGAVLVVGDLNEGRRGAAIDQLEAEDVGVGERGSDVGVERGGLSLWLSGLLELAVALVWRLFSLLSSLSVSPRDSPSREFHWGISISISKKRTHLLSNCAKDLQGQKSEERRLEQHDDGTTNDANQKLGSAQLINQKRKRGR